MRRVLSESGQALVVVLLLMLLVLALAAGTAAVLVNENRVKLVDRERTQAFYAAHGALEKLTSDLGMLFSTTYAPKGPQVSALGANPPALPGVTFPATSEGGTSTPGYAIVFTPDADGNPLAEPPRNITSGRFDGLTGLITRYRLTANARTAGGEARLERVVQTVSIPVFQFGLFSETDLSFFPGPNFNFGGRVHTNGNLFMASRATLTFGDKVSAVGEVVRSNLSNGWVVPGDYDGVVNVQTTPGAFRNLRSDEGSVNGVPGMPGTGQIAGWNNLSLGTYNGNIRSGTTGAKRLDLPLITVGSNPIEMIRRAPIGEPVTGTVFEQRYFGMASLRILLSDQAADLLPPVPTMTGGAPVDLSTALPAWYVADRTHPPLAAATTEYMMDGGGDFAAGRACDPTHTPGRNGRAPNPPWCTDVSIIPPGQSLHTGFIKIEMQDRAGSWSDVTQEILSLGIGGINPVFSQCLATPVSPDAVIRLQRVRDDPATGTAMPAKCGVTASAATPNAATDFWPSMLFDPREGFTRDTGAPPGSTTTVTLGGIMHYVELDVRNLSRWFRGEIGANGPNALDRTGYVVYFSDRRSSVGPGGAESAEYDNEDFVNPETANGSPNGVLDRGEDVNGNGQLDFSGRTPMVPANIKGGRLGTLASAIMAGATPNTWTEPARMMVNPSLFFRRALKLTNGAAGIVMPGLTVASENPVYVQGNYNANGSFSAGNPACSILADAVTFLSNEWTDDISFKFPGARGSRTQTSDAWYRVAILAGKGISFPRPTAGAPAGDFGTDGGVHNFLRYLEHWTHTVHYRGSLASFFYNRQATGTYKCCNTVYNAPTRDYQFDLNFLDPTLLPPRTPMFRDVNATGFTRIVAAPR